MNDKIEYESNQDFEEDSIIAPFSVSEIAFHVLDADGKEDERYLEHLFPKCNELLESKPKSNRGAVVRTIEVENPYIDFVKQLYKENKKRKAAEIER